MGSLESRLFLGLKAGLGDASRRRALERTRCGVLQDASRKRAAAPLGAESEIEKDAALHFALVDSRHLVSTRSMRDNDTRSAGGKSSGSPFWNPVRSSIPHRLSPRRYSQNAWILNSASS